MNCKPRAVYLPSAKVSTSLSVELLVDELVSLNILSPALNLVVVVLGIVNVPDTAPFASVVS